MTLIVFLVGFGIGLLAARWYGAAETHAASAITPHPGSPFAEPPPRGVYKVVLVNQDGQVRAEQTMNHLPRVIYRQRGKLASDVYRYDGINDNGTYRFRMVIHGSE